MTDLLTAAVPCLLALTLHESAHAYAAKRLGDDTAHKLGRVTLNPIRHVDLLGTVLVPLLLFWITSGAVIFGWAKSVPIAAKLLRRPDYDLTLVAAAGPLANAAMLGIWLGLGLLTANKVPEMAAVGVAVNFIMFVINMLPIKPLDGWQMVTAMARYEAGR